MIIMNGIRRDGGHGKRPLTYDFSGLASGSFSEEIDGNQRTIFTTEQDTKGQITKISAPTLDDVNIIWKQEWVPPYLMLANGSRVEVMEARTEPPEPDPLFPGDVLVRDVGKTGSAFYPDVQSAGVDLSYEFENGCILEYEHGVEFRLRDRRGTIMEPRRSLRDMPNTYGVNLWYAYRNGDLLIGIDYHNVTYCRVQSRANNGIPGMLSIIKQDKTPGLTEEYHAWYKHIAEELTAPHL